MSNRKGGDFERAISKVLKHLFPRIQRTGIGFQGSDFRETGPFAFEAKNHKRMTLSEWVNQAQLNCENEQRRHPVVIHKRVRFGPERAYVTMDLGDWMLMVADLLNTELPAPIHLSEEFMEDILLVSDLPEWPNWDGYEMEDEEE